MPEVSKLSEWLVTKLVAWELLGIEDDPKRVLRRLPQRDLRALSENVTHQPDLDQFAVTKMVELELQFRRGELVGDWHYNRTGECLTIKYLPTSSLTIPAQPSPSLRH
jgi:hypothetical protein